MKYCTQCGEKLVDSAMFCSNCGAKQPVFEAAAAEAAEYAEETVRAEAAEAEASIAAAEAEIENFAEEAAEAAPAAAAAYAAGYEAEPAGYAAEPAPKAKKNRTGLFVLLGVIAAALVAALVLGVTGAYANLIPQSKLKLGLAENKLYNETMDEVIRAMPENNGVKADLDVAWHIDIDDPDGYMTETMDLLNNLKLLIGIDTTDVLDLAVRGDYNGNTVEDIRLFIDKDVLGFYFAPADDNVYTMTREALLKKIDEDFDVSKTDFLFERFDRDAVRRDTDALFAIFADVLKNADIDIQKNQTVDLFYDGSNTEEVKAAVYTVNLTEEQVTELLNKVADYIESDECYTGKLLENVVALMNEFDLFSALEELADGAEPVEDLLYDIEDFDDLMKYFRDNIPELAKKYVEGEYKFEAVMKGNEILRQRIYGKDGSAGYDCIEQGNTKHTYIRVEDADGEVIYYTDILDQTEGSILQRNVNAYNDGATANYKGTFNLDKKDVLGMPECSYESTVCDEDGDQVVFAQLMTQLENGVMTYNINVVPGEYYLGDEIKSVQVTMRSSAGNGVEKPAGAEEIDISDYTDSQLERLMFNLMIKFYSGLSDAGISLF